MKLLEFQKRVEAIAKDSMNPHFKNKYFDINKIIEEIKPLLNELGLILIQPLTFVDGKNVLVTMIIDSTDGKTLAESSIMLPDIQDPQKIGSAITYYRRYSIQSMLFLEAEDDDANLASGKTTQTTQTSYQRPPVTSQDTPINAMAYKQMEAVVGSECNKCGSKIVKWTSGKVGCSGKCWLPENAHLVAAYNNSKVSIDDFGLDAKPVSQIF